MTTHWQGWCEYPHGWFNVKCTKYNDMWVTEFRPPSMGGAGVIAENVQYLRPITRWRLVDENGRVI